MADSIPESVPILIVAGETSGEQHAAGLVAEVQRRCPTRCLRWFGSGGLRMAATGVELLQDVSRLGAIGPWDALLQVRTYWRLYRRLMREARCRRPGLAVLVDFPEFNLRLAKGLKALGIPVCYFVSPQIWAWRPWRLRLIRRCVDLMLVILPFEEEYYRKCGVSVRYVGNPTKSDFTLNPPANSDRLPPLASSDQRPVLALLPGSRASEVERILPIELDAALCVAAQKPVQVWVIQAPAVRAEQIRKVYTKWLNKGGRPLPLEVRQEGTRDLLARADCAIIKSGTSTLEATLLQVPFAMVYRMPWLSWCLARPFVTTKTYCLTNLIAGERIVPEFVQHQAVGKDIGAYILGLLADENEHRKVKEALRVASQRLGEQDAYREAARCVVEFLVRD